VERLLSYALHSSSAESLGASKALEALFARSADGQHALTSEEADELHSVLTTAEDKALALAGAVDASR
jgi:hypothetical protein